MAMFLEKHTIDIDIRILLVGGFNPSEKYEFVSWDDDIPNIWKVIKVYKSHVPNHQPVMIIYLCVVEWREPSTIYPLVN